MYLKRFFLVSFMLWALSWLREYIAVASRILQSVSKNDKSVDNNSAQCGTLWCEGRENRPLSQIVKTLGELSKSCELHLEREGSHV